MTQKKREDGSSTAYKLSWRGSDWRMFFPPVGTVSRAIRTGHPGNVARMQPDSPGVYELAITMKNEPETRIKVFVGSTVSLAKDVAGLADEQHPLNGFIEHALKENHAIFIRTKESKSPEAADEALTKILTAFDYAWNDQHKAPARSLVLKPKYACCGCLWRRGVHAVPGPAKRTKGPGLLAGMMSLGRSKKR